ncbi:methyl-accepting chemotaxis protein [Grimontia marina]|uniref:Methyl-accepting chemotaxis protein PctB n=1 Tax=Grimontia marina TaxID=646534 RepID=A0A128EZS1_9GAMM|nr:methyl-accepting chemotaxis protein [Grimontia marina]CZF79496.1 Methyl-accepting chemotaxis protein PctB [Grimontia marina]
MKVSYRVALLSTTVVIGVLSALSWFQYQNVKQEELDMSKRNTLETTAAMGEQITNWLNGKLALIDMMAENINADFSAETIQTTFDLPILKEEFILIFGGLDTDGKRITNNPSWNPEGWDARKRPWYPFAKKNSSARLTDPYADAATKEILISAVANLYDNGVSKGAFGGDLSLDTVSKALNTLNFNNTGYAFLLSADGTIISHPNGDLNGLKISKLYKGDTLPVLDEAFQKVETDNGSALTVFHKLDKLTGTNWLIGVVLDEQTLMANSEEFGFVSMITTAVCAILIGLLLSMVTSRQLRPLVNLRESLEEINSGDGDLTKRLAIKSNDEFGGVSKEFDGFIDYLQTLVKSIKGTSDQVSDNVRQTVSSAKNAAEGAEHQLKEISLVSHAIHEMTDISNDVAERARNAAEVVAESTEATNKGGESVEKTKTSIDLLMGEMETAVSKVNELAKYSANIESILTVITDIAEQTNLLALNAAIEAARAGEMGRGFAVVADEVRALASRTQTSTEEIKNMIAQLQAGVGEAESVIIKSRNTASSTQEVVLGANSALTDVHNHIYRINELINEISESSFKQRDTANDIQQNTDNIRDISETLSQRAKEQETLCVAISDLAGQQENELNKFKV